MADTKKNIETIVDVASKVNPTYGMILKVTFKFLDFVGYFGNPDPIGNAVRLLSEEVQKLRQDLERIKERINILAQLFIQFENKNRVQRLEEFVRDLNRLQFQLSQNPADVNARGLIAHEAGAIAEVFLNDIDLWSWTDTEITSVYDDNNVLISTEIGPMPPDFKAYPALPIYILAVTTWLAAIELHAQGNYQLVQQQYGDRLRRHIKMVLTRPDWNELEQPPSTFPEHIQARITCYPDALHSYATNNECHFAITCNNVMDRGITSVENSDFVIPFPTGTLCTADPARGLNDERHIEADRGVDALTQLGEILIRVEKTGTLRPPFIGRFDHTPSHNVAFVYAVRPDGELLWWKQQPSVDPNALAGWAGPRGVGSEWADLVAVYPAGGNRFYALRPDGVLVWYQHDGFNDGMRQWKPAIVIGNEWNSPAKIFAGSDGVMYAVHTDGTLFWYKNDGYRDGVKIWRPPTFVGSSGWNQFKTIFSCGNGIIYAVANDGTLFWYRHKGFDNGTNIWDGPLRIASGWQNFSHIFSVGDGVIYAIQPDGTMLWYKHDGFRDGAQRWRGPLPAGNGWTAFRYVFPLLPSTPDPIH